MPMSVQFSTVTLTAPAMFGGDGPQAQESLGLGTFAIVDILARALLQGAGGRVPLVQQVV